jgi:hypothetical protein
VEHSVRTKQELERVCAETVFHFGEIREIRRQSRERKRETAVAEITGSCGSGRQKMLMVFDSLVFMAAAAAAGYAIRATVSPNLTKIRAALAGQSQHFAPLQTLVQAERRIAVRRWAAAPRSAVRWREAA